MSAFEIFSKMDKWHYDIGTLTRQDVHHPDRLNESGALGRELIAVEKIEDKPRKWQVVCEKPLPKGYFRGTKVQLGSSYYGIPSHTIKGM